jgi:uncharacterized protein (TIGR00251 family)
MDSISHTNAKMCRARSRLFGTMIRVAIVQFHVNPNAKVDQIVGEHSGVIKIKLRAPALEGKANAALLSFLATKLKIPKRAILLERGQRSRDKLIRIEGLSEEDVRQRLLGPT